MINEPINFEEEDGEEESFADLFEQSAVNLAPLRPGQKVDATVLQISSEWVFLDVGQKGEGVVDLRELQDTEGELTVAVGEKIGVYFISHKGGEMTFTTKIGGGSAGTEQLEQAWQNAIPVEGRIEKELKGGFEIKLPGNVRSFCPFSQLGLGRIEDSSTVIGESLSFRIIKFEERGRNIVVSHRVIKDEARELERDSLKDQLQVGMRVQGTVRSIQTFGAFVDIGFIEGLLPISEVGYSRIENLEEVLEVGQQLDLIIKRLDWEENKFSFSLRDALADPWEKVGTDYKVGMELTGKVSRLAPFGAFVTLEDGIDGLAHISKLGDGKHLRHPQDIMSVGDTLQVVIEKIDKEERRISLTLPGKEEETGDTSYADAPSAAGMGSFAELLKAAQDKKDKKKKRKK